MAGPPAQDASEHHSRKRRGSHITLDKSKKSTSDQSPPGADKSITKSVSMDPPEVEASTSTAPSTTKGVSAPNDKPKGPVGDASAKQKGAKSDYMGKASKTKSAKAPIKDKKPEGSETATAKKDDANVKKDDIKEKKADTKENKPDAKYNKLDAKNKSTKLELPKPNEGVKLPELVKPAPSDSESSADSDSDDYDHSEDSDSLDDSHESGDSDDSNESSNTSDSELASDIDYFDEGLYNYFAMEYQNLDDLSPERLAVEKAKTLRHVQNFVDNTKDKHYHEFKLETLTGPANYISWVVGLEVLLRMHQVWPVVGELNVPLDKDHEMYPWYDHMINVAVSLIYAHVSKQVRSHRCFMSGVMQRNPGCMMQHIWAHFGRPDADEYEH